MINKKLYPLIVFIWTLSYLVTYSQLITLDQEFGENGVSRTSMEGFKDNGLVVSKLWTNYVQCIFAFSDSGTIIQGINLDTLDSYDSGIFAILKLTNSGEPDLEFGNQGSSIYYFEENLETLELDILKDDNLLIGNGTDCAENPEGFTIYLTHPDGMIDTSFGQNGKISNLFQVRGGCGNFSNNLHAMDVDQNGYLYVTGDTSAIGQIWRYDTYGKIDSSFGLNGKLQFETNYPRLVTLADNKLLISMNIESGIIKRYEWSGEIDSTFGIEGAQFSPLGGGAFLPFRTTSNGNILLSGKFENSDSGGLFKLNSNGLIDSSFGNYGVLEVPTSWDPRIHVLADESLFLYEEGNIYYYNEYGEIVYGFGEKGVLKIEIPDFFGGIFKEKDFHFINDHEFFICGVLDNGEYISDLIVMKYTIGEISPSSVEKIEDEITMNIIFPNPIPINQKFTISERFFGIFDIMGRFVSSKAISPSIPGIYYVVCSKGTYKLVVTN